MITVSRPRYESDLHSDIRLLTLADIEVFFFVVKSGPHVNIITYRKERRISSNIHYAFETNMVTYFIHYEHVMCNFIYN
jgi:hypothetical protein